MEASFLAPVCSVLRDVFQGGHAISLEQSVEDDEDEEGVADS